ncbi:MAG TPA: NAD(P)-binding protein [Planctomycetota bacterium]|nr:NAD(P)-binding protein [Planctomycetota bacterium]
MSDLTRREFLAGSLGLAALSGCPASHETTTVDAPRRAGIQGVIVGQDDRRGHLLRSGELLAKPVAETVTVPTLIVGAGVSGLACAWRLRREGIEDVSILELADAPGGNARSGENEVSPFPWGAHYLRAPTPDSRALTALLEDLRVIRGHDSKGRPDYDTRYVCSEPMERIFESGVWAEGLFPPPGSARAADKAELARFRAELVALARARDEKGRRPFAIPVDRSGESSKELDKVSFASWLDGKGFTSRSLRWLVEYACRDDYGSLLGMTSAWAGLHYFLARGLEDEPDAPPEDRDEGTTLVWPEGNGWLVKNLAKPARVETNRLVYRIFPAEGAVLAWDPLRERAIRYEAQNLVFAGARFLLRFLLEKPPEGLAEFEYAPWLAVNLTLSRSPGGVGAPLAWDNVLYESPSLGYVVATRGKPENEKQVVTWYHAFTEPDARAHLHAMTWEQIRDMCLSDLERAHPRIADLVLRLDAWRWGHAMIRPRPGFLWGPARAKAQEPIEKLLTANSDKGGLPIFEEAFHQGALAGEQILARMGKTFVSLCN